MTEVTGAGGVVVELCATLTSPSSFMDYTTAAKVE